MYSTIAAVELYESVCDWIHKLAVSATIDTLLHIHYSFRYVSLDILQMIHCFFFSPAKQTNTHGQTNLLYQPKFGHNK